MIQLSILYRNFASVQNIKRESNPTMDLLKFTFNKEIPSGVTLLKVTSSVILSNIISLNNLLITW